MSRQNKQPSAESVNRDFQRKNLFSYFLPYGVINRPALNTVLPHAASYDVIYDPEVSLEQMAEQCERKWEVNSTQLRILEQSCYIQEKSYATKVQSIRTRMYIARQPALNLLAGVLDWKTECTRQQEVDALKAATGGKFKTVCYLPGSRNQRLLDRLEMHRSCAQRSYEHQEVYERMLCDAICYWDVTMLGTAPELISQVSTAGYAHIDQRIQFSKLSAITMMFRQNQYLTFLDRRPLDTNWAIRNVDNDTEFKRQLVDGKIDIPLLTAHCLREWYGKYPDSYLFSEPGKLLSENYEEWINTPTFYALSEIPGYLISAEELGAKGKIEKEKKNTLRSSAIGIGIGAYVNYLIYYMPQGRFRWHSGIEKNASKYIHEILKKINTENNIPGFDRSTDFAIMLFGTMYQFEAVFADLLDKGLTWHSPNQIPQPYSRMFLIPVNPSGVQQLRMLMEYTPYEFVQTVVRDICHIDKEYATRTGMEPMMYPTNDPDYPLAYKGQPVLFAYDMEIRKLRQALISYQMGKKFYVACYPEQVRYIRRIMPKVEFI